MSVINLSRKAGESELSYIKRLGDAKEAGLIDMTWPELATIFNKELREPNVKLGESAYRKKYASLRKFNEEFGVFNISDEVEELKQLKDEIYKEKRKLFDQRREYNKLLTADARAEHLDNYMIMAANQLNDNCPLINIDNVYRDPKKEAIACWSDWHYGMITDNIWNVYDTSICKARVETCIKYMKKYLCENNIHTLHIVLLGDAAHGAIHCTARIKSEEDTCDQIMNVAEIMAEGIQELSTVVDNVIVYSCYGNHLRTVQKKEDSIHSDNMEKLIPWWLEQRLKHNTSVEIKYSQYKEFTYFKVFDYNIVAVHGDGFNFKDIGVEVNTLFTKLFNTSIDYTISGDKHHLEEIGQYGIDSILVRSLCGCDDYAAGKHLYDKPGQTLIIFNDEYGREATYHIPLG